MRHPLLQRFTSAVLLVGMFATVLPFGPEALAEGQWTAWLEALTAAHRSEVTADAPASAPDGLTPRVDPRPVIIPATLPSAASGSGMTWVGVVGQSVTVALSAEAPSLWEPAVRVIVLPALGRAISPRAP